MGYLIVQILFCGLLIFLMLQFYSFLIGKKYRTPITIYTKRIINISLPPIKPPKPAPTKPTIKTIIDRESFPLSKLVLNKNIISIYDFRYEDIRIENYKSHPNIKVDVAV